MDNKKNVYELFMQAKATFHNTTMKKSGSAGGRYKFFELADIIPVATKVLTENGLVAIVKEIGKETATMEIVNVSDKEDKIDFTINITDAIVKLAGGGQPIQNRGAEITYIRRYLYFVALDIIEKDVIDGADLIMTPEQKDEAKAEKEALKKVIAEISPLAVALGKTDKQKTIELIMKHHSSANFNTIKSLEVAEKVLAELKEATK